MTEKRKSGYYRVFYDGQWRVAEWCNESFGGFFQLTGDDACLIDEDFTEIDETPIPNISISTIKETLNRAQCELQAMYKRTGIKGSNVLDEINKLYDSL